MKLKTLVLLAATSCFAIGLAACESHPAEKAGESIDNAAYSVKSAAQDATGTKGAAQQAGESIDNATN